MRLMGVRLRGMRLEQLARERLRCAQDLVECLACVLLIPRRAAQRLRVQHLVQQKIEISHTKNHAIRRDATHTDP